MLILTLEHLRPFILFIFRIRASVSEYGVDESTKEKPEFWVDFRPILWLVKPRLRLHYYTDLEAREAAGGTLLLELNFPFGLGILTVALLDNDILEALLSAIKANRYDHYLYLALCQIIREDALMTFESRYAELKITSVRLTQATTVVKVAGVGPEDSEILSDLQPIVLKDIREQGIAQLHSVLGLWSMTLSRGCSLSIDTSEGQAITAEKIQFHRPTASRVSTKEAVAALHVVKRLLERDLRTYRPKTDRYAFAKALLAFWPTVAAIEE